MKIFTIIASAIILIGVVVGLVCQFTGYGYFNAGGNWGSDSNVTVEWYYVDGYTGEDDLEEICSQAFDDAGLSYYAVEYGDMSSGEGGQIVYRFSKKTSEDDLAAAIEDINAQIDAQVDARFNSEQQTEKYISLSRANYHFDDGLVNVTRNLFWAGIGLASFVALEFVYVIIRYKVSMGLASLSASFVTLALYLSLLSACRIPVGSSMIAFGVFAVILTSVATLITFGKIRANNRNEDYKELTSEQIVDKSCTESFALNTGLICSIGGVVIIALIFMWISAGSIAAVLTPLLSVIAAVVASYYTSLLFFPSTYAPMRQIGLRFKRKEKPEKTKDKAKGEESPDGAPLTAEE